jgi:hypothetical protein
MILVLVRLIYAWFFNHAFNLDVEFLQRVSWMWFYLRVSTVAVLVLDISHVTSVENSWKLHSSECELCIM